MLPYSKQVQKALIAAADLDIEIIANSHGIIWRKYVKEVLKAYSEWASNDVQKRALVIYDSMWHSTEAMAQTIQAVFTERGDSTNLLSLQHHHISDVMTQVIGAEYLCFGSPALNGKMLPTMAAFLTYLSGLAPKDRKAFVFGSYGWGPKHIKDMSEMLENAGINVLGTEKIKYIPSEQDLNALAEKVNGLIPKEG